jgi:cytochrome c biogenesis protein CcdA
MTLIVLAYLGGILTIVSPCVLPVVPFVFTRAGRPFATSILPLLAGMAVTFALVATLAAVGGGWVVKANELGRLLAMVRCPRARRELRCCAPAVPASHHG